MQIKVDKDEEVQRAIVKGSFLGAGSITDPNKQYHLEIIFQEKNNAEYILNICKAFGIVSSGTASVGDGTATFKVYKKPVTDIVVGLKGV